MRTEDCEFELDTVEGKATFTRSWTMEVDGNYGADADGRRGESRTFIEDHGATDVYVNDKPLAEYSKEFRDAVDKEVQAYLDTNEPDCSDEEPDYETDD